MITLCRRAVLWAARLEARLAKADTGLRETRAILIVGVFSGHYRQRVGLHVNVSSPDNVV